MWFQVISLHEWGNYTRTEVFQKEDDNGYKVRDWLDPTRRDEDGNVKSAIWDDVGPKPNGHSKRGLHNVTYPMKRIADGMFVVGKAYSMKDGPIKVSCHAFESEAIAWEFIDKLLVGGLPTGIKIKHGVDGVVAGGYREKVDAWLRGEAA